ncbi:succinylglutamate desuccinylase/aspartoacylase family protein (plasmid) [Rhizobium sp. RCAM05350]|uniref:succinylglutamate desuccinylase/aspartoacylase family protein n=1 Tax=Rhizobium sp. RCAM05350 TaxID=2895568 RepID=UPI0020768212|nr:succinylglutamate desuccinylase/aspartoacylase family protein [Rhizobium sp. RCAM05350]URK89406.1 succinylglutamate desuccinylase/aspartoacylase family protein [Rhizobium sp. RCAM05350]
MASGEIAGGVSGALDAVCASEGITAFMAEVGSGGEFQDSPITSGVAGVRSVMAHLGMIEERDTAPVFNDRKIVTKQGFADTAGMLTDCVASGTLVKGGAPLCRVVDFFNDKGAMQMRDDAIVICHAAILWSMKVIA